MEYETLRQNKKSMLQHPCSPWTKKQMYEGEKPLDH